MPCKICGCSDLRIVAHTAKCAGCGVLLYYPYPSDSDLAPSETAAESSEQWYDRAARRNHDNFGQMLAFALDEEDYHRPLDVLDYGGGGGQFALVCKSMLPRSRVWIADISDHGVLDLYKPMLSQIPWRKFVRDETKFDLIMLNDVYEHVSDPVAVLSLLRTKLKPGGRLFIDTPKQFWLYPALRPTKLYEKLLRGTVSKAHLQIWTKGSFELSVAKAGMKVERYKEVSEFTMDPEYYLKNMGVANPVTVFLGRVFYRAAKWISANKILAVIQPVA